MGCEASTKKKLVGLPFCVLNDREMVWDIFGLLVCDEVLNHIATILLIAFLNLVTLKVFWGYDWKQLFL